MKVKVFIGLISLFSATGVDAIKMMPDFGQAIKDVKIIMREMNGGHPAPGGPVH